MLWHAKLPTYGPHRCHRSGLLRNNYSFIPVLILRVVNGDSFWHRRLILTSENKDASYGSIGSRRSGRPDADTEITLYYQDVSQCW